VYYPRLTEDPRTRVQTDTFGGYNHNLRILAGEWYDEGNLTSSYYPLFSQRDKRGTIATLTNPQGMIAKDALMYVDGAALYYNGAVVSGVTLSTAADMIPKQIVSMGAYAVIFPDKIYVNTANLTDHGSLDATFTSVAGANVTYQMCKADGTDYDLSSAAVSATAPESPVNGQMWIDTSGDVHAMKQYSTSSGLWVTIATVYVKIGYPNIGLNFAQYDGITISGCAYVGDNSALGAQIAGLNGEKIVYARGADYIITVGIIDQAYTQASGSVTVKRESPSLDYVCESQNRLWGCKYGMVDGSPVNTIYACALGDFKNWKRFMGVSTDSYYVNVGTDGKFTGAISYLGYPLFFKETCMHKIAGSMPSEYTVYTDFLRGVEDGSYRSLAIVAEKLYYKARGDVCVYDGSLPTSISDKMGDVKYTAAVAGAIGSKYYISMRDAQNAWHLFVYDTYRGLWHREDAIHALAFAELRGDLVFINAATNALQSVTGASGTPEASVAWYAESGIMGYEYPDRQYLSRFNIRVKLGTGATLAMYLEYDSTGGWVEMGSYTGTSLMNTITVPVIPRRCDHLRLKLAGTGDVKIYSIARILELGSDA
jgi:hypothetical protein